MRAGSQLQRNGRQRPSTELQGKHFKQCHVFAHDGQSQSILPQRRSVSRRRRPRGKKNNNNKNNKNKIFKNKKFKQTVAETGVLIRSPLGLLVWMGNDEKTSATNLGSRLKTPIYPIWLVLVCDQIGLLFCQDRALMRDYRNEYR